MWLCDELHPTEEMGVLHMDHIFDARSARAGDEAMPN